MELKLYIFLNELKHPAVQMNILSSNTNFIFCLDIYLTDGRTDKWTNGQTDGWTDKQTYKWTNGWTYR